jgi:uncharacterized membrane protein
MNELILGICTISTVAALCHAQAVLTRPELYFAVTVNAEFRRTATARRILARYAAIGWTGTLTMLALLVGGAMGAQLSIFLTVSVWLAAFFAARTSTRPYAMKPTTVREVSLATTDHERFRGGLPLALGPGLILAAKAIWVHLHWNDIPSRIPVHWGLNGPDRWVDRTPLAVYGFIAMIAAVSLMMSLAGYATMYASRRVAATGPAAEIERKYRTAGFAGLLALAYVLAIVAPPIEGAIPEVPFAPAIIIVTSLAMVVTLMYYGQGGTRLSYAHTSVVNDPPVGDRTADDRWKWGVFYYNPDDPAFLVEKRFGLGWTWNFGHRLSWLLIPVLVLTIIAPLLLR